MVDIDSILSGKTDMRTAIHAELTEVVCKKLGYEFSAERLARIAFESCAAMDECSAPFPAAFAHALELELVMYGDPRWHGTPVGIFGIVK